MPDYGRAVRFGDQGCAATPQRALRKAPWVAPLDYTSHLHFIRGKGHALGPNTVIDDFHGIRHTQRRIAEGICAAEQEHHEDQGVGGVYIGAIRVVLLDRSHDKQTQTHEHCGPQQDEHTAKALGQIRAGRRKEQVRDLQTESPAVALGLQHADPADFVFLLVVQDLLDFLKLESHKRRLVAIAVVIFQNLQGLVFAVGVHEEPRSLWNEGEQRQTEHGRRDLPQGNASPCPAGFFRVSAERDARGDYCRQVPAGHVNASKEAAVLRFDHLGDVCWGADRVDGDGHADDNPADDEHGSVAGTGLQTHAQKRQHRSNKHASLAPHAANINQLSSKKTSENRPDVDGGGKKPLHAGV
ncbi:hypothetical protein OGATHE_000440 [Ogataea polymorpha]|uniref:Uncharacterized protein n=1 Tax=Ogataea polymorpha TaxID=460523 RepID=A0A9P8PT47_9ASCO|nr:hypothetical protein OGATHE_000440 [Ogataea polymorpha]